MDNEKKKAPERRHNGSERPNHLLSGSGAFLGFAGRMRAPAHRGLKHMRYWFFSLLRRGAGCRACFSPIRRNYAF